MAHSQPRALLAFWAAGNLVLDWATTWWQNHVTLTYRSLKSEIWGAKNFRMGHSHTTERNRKNIIHVFYIFFSNSSFRIAMACWETMALLVLFAHAGDVSQRAAIVAHPREFSQTDGQRIDGWFKQVNGNVRISSKSIQIIQSGNKNDFPQTCSKKNGWKTNQTSPCFFRLRPSSSSQSLGGLQCRPKRWQRIRGV